MNGGLRIGIDVGGTFTKAVAVDAATLELRASAALPTTHEATEGVAEGIAQVDPYAVDVASGTEAQPGVKDPARLRAFMEAAGVGAEVA